MPGTPNCPNCGKRMNRHDYSYFFDTVDPETGERKQRPSDYSCRHCGYTEEPPETVEGSEA